MAQSESAARELAAQMDGPRREAEKRTYGTPRHDVIAEQEAARDKRVPKHF